MFSLENLFYPCFQSNETFQPRIFKIKKSVQGLMGIINDNIRQEKVELGQDKGMKELSGCSRTVKVRQDRRDLCPGGEEADPVLSTARPWSVL